MAWAFDVVSGFPRITQTGTDANLGGMATAINAVATVARSTAVAAGAILRPPAANGLWYRCSTAGTTAASAPLYNASEGGSTTDGTAVFVGFLAPIIRTIAGGNHYYMPSVRVQVNGTLTNASPQQNTFTCFDVEMSGGNWTSGAYASDGVTPLWSGLHFAAMRQGSAGAEESDGGLRLLSGAQFTFIGGEVQVAGSIVFNSGTTPRTYGTRWRNSREFGASSARIRNKTANAIFSQVELFDIAFDLFVMPTTAPSIKARGSEYVYQYVGGPFGGIDARFVAYDLENPSGTHDFDCFGSGWAELYNCKAGAALRVVTQHPSSTFWVKFCVPLYQDLVITAKDTAGVVVQDVRFTATESPTNSPTVTFVTQGNLKTWDFRDAATYQTTTNASGVALSSPVLNVWYWQTTFKQSLRFPSSTVVYQGRAYNYKTLTVSAVLGASAAIPVSAGMISLDTATHITEAAALAQTKVTFTPSGANGGTFTSTASHTLKELWSYYRAFISQFANRASNDTWGCVAGNLTAGAWNHVVNSGVTVSGSDDVTSYATTGSVTNNGAITTVYTSSAGTSSILQLVNVTAAGVAAVWHPSTSATELFQTNVSGSAADYTVYYPPGSVGLVKNYARELFGSQRVSGSITLAAGLNTMSFVDIPDVGISNTSQSAVTAYTTIEGPSKRYDRTAIFRLTEQGIKLGQIVTRSGTNLEGTFSVFVRDDAPAVYSVLGNVITIKAASYEADSKYTKELVTGGGTFTAFDTELITIDIEDANGDSSVLVQGTTGGLVDVWKCVNGTINSDYATGTKIGSNISSGKFRFTGTDGFKLIFYDKNTLLARDCSMSKGNYVLGWYLYDAPTGGLTQEQNVNFSNMVTKVNDIFADVNSVTTGFVEATDNLHAIRAAVDTTPSQTATAVWTAATRTLTSAGASGATLAEIEASTVLAKQAAVTALGTPLQASAYTAPANSDIAAIKSKTDTLVNAPTVAQLEASALAKQSDVAFLGSPLQASAYVEPANSDIAAIKAKTDTLINTDISGLATAVQVGTPLQASAYTAPANSDIAAIKAKTDTLVNAPTVAQLEASALAKQSAVTALGSPLQASAYVAPPTATAIATAVEVAIITENDGNAVLQAIADKIGNENLSAAAVASAVRTELATELSKLDATVSSRLATTGYTAPANSDIAAIKSKTDTLVNAPTVAELEASELAKQASVVALGSPLQASAYTAPANSDIAAIKAKTDTLVNTDTTALAKKTDVEVVNQGVKNASLLIPHTTNLPT